MHSPDADEALRAHICVASYAVLEWRWRRRERAGAGRFGVR